MESMSAGTGSLPSGGARLSTIRQQEPRSARAVPGPSSAEQAGRRGRELAARYREIDPDPLVEHDAGLDRKYRSVVAELAEHSRDPEFTAAFFAGLGLEGTLALPGRLDRALGGTAPEYLSDALDVVAQAFGTAVSGGSATPGFAILAEHAKRAPGVARLLRGGDFPTAWLAEAVALQVFTPGNKVAGAELTPYLNALARDPAATGLAFALATCDGPATVSPLTPAGAADRRPVLDAFLRDLAERAARHETSRLAYGGLIAAYQAYAEGRGGRGR